MDKLDKLLKLIEEGNEEKILEEKDLTKAFNKLCKYDLVEIKEDGIFLTTNGKLAKREGVANFIRQLESDIYHSDFSSGKIKKEKISFKLSLILLIIIFLFFLIINVE